MAITTMSPPVNQPVVQAIGAPRSTFYKYRQQERLSQPIPISVAKPPKKAASTKRSSLIPATEICISYLARNHRKYLPIIKRRYSKD
jgi:hypothetical protein